MSDLKIVCETCIYFKTQSELAGACRRYPTAKLKPKTSWCGEHTATWEERTSLHELLNELEDIDSRLEDIENNMGR